MKKIPFRADSSACLEHYKSLYPNDSHKYQLFKWQYSSPATKRADISPLLYVDSEDQAALAFNGLMPVDTWENGRDSISYWSCDFFVSKKARGRGLGKQVKQELKALTKGHNVMSLGISDTAYHVLQKMGWRTNTDSKVELFTNSHFDKRLGFKHGLKVLYQKTFASIHNNQQIELTDSTYCYQTSLSLPPEGEVQALWHNVKHGYCKIVARNYEYLNWKYQQHPVCAGVYRYLIGRDSHSKLASILIYRVAQNTVSIVDYLGPKKALALKYQAIENILKAYPARSLSMSTNDFEFKQCLGALGFYKHKQSQRFVAYNETSDDTEENWFLMGGDSDGEFLQAAFNCSNNQFQFHLASEQEFENLQPQWTSLLKSSQANELFMSWEWQFTWWRIWSVKLELKLQLILVFQEGDLVAILPCYMDNKSSFHSVSGSRLHFIGNRTRTSSTVRTEYISPIIKSGVSNLLLPQLAKFISTHLHWRELMLADITLEKNAEMKALVQLLSQLHQSHIWEKVDGYVVNTQQQLDVYKQLLGKNSRASYFNKWKRQELADLKHVEYQDSEVIQYLSELNALHEKRWHKSAFDKDALEFHYGFIEQVSKAKHMDSKMLALVDDNQVVSCSYNIEVNNSIYNLQSGYVEKYKSGLALGKLHLGLCITEAFANSQICQFDLLAGTGKNSNYKSSLRGEAVEFSTLAFYRGKLSLFYITLKAIYKARQFKLFGRRSG